VIDIADFVIQGFWDSIRQHPEISKLRNHCCPEKKVSVSLNRSVACILAIEHKRRPGIDRTSPVPA